MAAGLPSAVLVEIEFTAGAWTDVSSLVKGESLEMRVGRDSAASGIQPGTLDLDLDNADGRFTPDNPTSTYYPNFVEGKRIRVRVTKSATTYVRFVGRITNLEPDFPTEPTQSVTHLAAVDLLGDLARIELPSVQEAYARLNTDGQAAFYPLTDVNEHAGMVDVLGNAARLRIWNRTPSAGSIDAHSDTSLFETRAYAVLKSGKGFYSTTPFPDSIVYGLGSGSMGVILLVKVTSSSYGEVARLSVSRCDVASDYNVLRWTSSGFVLDTYIGGALFGSSTTVAADDGWHHIDLRVDQFTVDGTGLGLGLSPGGNARHVSFGGDIDMSVGDAMIFADDLLAGAYSAGSVGLDSRTLTQLASDLETVTGSVGLAATYTWTTAPTPNGAALLTEGRSALDALLDLADSESGIAYAVPSTSATQVVQLVSTDDSRSATVALTLDAEGDLSGGPTWIRDIDGMVATATASSSAGMVTATDASVTLVGAASTDVSTALADSNDLHGVATDRIARGRYQKLRPTVVPVDLATATNDLYASFYALTPGERVRLSGLPSAHFGVTYMDAYVEGWTERPGVTGYDVVLNLSPADAPPEAKLDDSTYGRFGFGDGVCTLTSTITSSATSISLTFTGSALLSTSAGDYPMDLDLNGERVTITSAPAGGTSPRTVTVTRGVAPTVARAHTAGEAIEVWNAARFAL